MIVDPFSEPPVPANDRRPPPTIIVDPFPTGPNTSDVPSPDNDEDDDTYADDDDENYPLLPSDDDDDDDDDDDNDDDDEGDIHGIAVQDPVSEIKPVETAPKFVSVSSSSPIEIAPETHKYENEVPPVAEAPKPASAPMPEVATLPKAGSPALTANIPPELTSPTTSSPADEWDDPEDEYDDDDDDDDEDPTDTYNLNDDGDEVPVAPKNKMT